MKWDDRVIEPLEGVDKPYAEYEARMRAYEAPRGVAQMEPNKEVVTQEQVEVVERLAAIVARKKGKVGVEYRGVPVKLTDTRTGESFFFDECGEQKPWPRGVEVELEL